MYSMSVLNLTKFRQVAISIKSGFGGQLDNAGNSIMNPASEAGAKPNVIPELAGIKPKQMATKMKKYIEEKGLEKNVRLRETEHGLVVSVLANNMVFEKGQADLTPRTKGVLRKVAGMVKGAGYHLRVEGHTDDLPIRTARYPSNWELSTSRATAVVRYLVDEIKFDPTQVSAAGYADSRPLHPNDSEEHRASNRRVDLVIVRGDGDSRP
jgi:chemotaxis protein MotB